MKGGYIGLAIIQTKRATRDNTLECREFSSPNADIDSIRKGKRYFKDPYAYNFFMYNKEYI